MFITLEGPEGSGKTTQIPALAEYLREQGYSILTTREPGGTAISNQVREVLLKMSNESMNARTEILLFQAARAQLVEEVIRPALAQDVVVLSDRYADSTLAYQGYGRETDIRQLEMIVNYATGCLKPDLTILFDLDVEIGLRRRQTSGGEWNRLDACALAFHQRVRQGYLTLAAQEPERWVILDANRPPDEVQSDLREIILYQLAIKRS